MSARKPRRVLRGLVVGVFAVAGWWVGMTTRDRSPAREPAVVARWTARVELPVLAPAGTPAGAPAGAAIATDARLHPRPPGEWDGMLVDMSQRQYCEASSYCGFALACLDDHACGPCQRDDQCAGGEVCVLDHCVLAAGAGCRTRSDCADGALCVLSGLTGGEPRGNGAMTSLCRASAGGSPQDDSVIDERRAARLAAAAEQTPVAPPISASDLRARLELDLRHAR